MVDQAVTRLLRAESQNALAENERWSRPESRAAYSKEKTGALVVNGSRRPAGIR